MHSALNALDFNNDVGDMSPFHVLRQQFGTFSNFEDNKYEINELSRRNSQMIYRRKGKNDEQAGSDDEGGVGEGEVQAGHDQFSLDHFEKHFNDDTLTFGGRPVPDKGK